MKTGAIIQARMNSRRFPGKSAGKVGGIYILQRMCAALIDYVDEVAVATGKAVDNLDIIGICSSLKMRCYVDEKNDEDDVLSRFIDCAKHYGFDTIVRATADNPFTDPYIVRRLLEEHEGGYTYAVNAQKGTAVEVVDLDVLEEYKFYIETREGMSWLWRSSSIEHVTTGIPPMIKNRVDSKHKVRFVDFSLSIDTPEDLERVEKWWAWKNA